ncbi:MAG TPA: ankyrin repeat domain-containing protein [Opitutales bacterium]|nr:ankyrin repeat domain-containing protein [Opitutales bacterium]
MLALPAGAFATRNADAGSDQPAPAPAPAAAEPVTTLEAQLRAAAEAGKVETVRGLLLANAQVNAPGDGNLTALHLAASGGYMEVVRLLLDAGAQVDPRDSADFTPMHYVAYSGHIDVVLLLLERGAIADPVGTNRSSPLHLAAAGNHLDLVQLLVDRGADPTRRNGRNLTPANLARTDLVRQFLEGAERNWLQRPGNPSLTEAPPTVTPQAHLLDDLGMALIQLLNDRPAVRVQAELSWQDLWATFDGSLNHVEAWFAAGGWANARYSGLSALHLAANKGEAEAVRRLLNAGSVVDPRDSAGFTPMHYAAHKGFIAIVRLLLGRGADINALGSNGSISLHLASAGDRLDIAELLVEQGAPPILRNLRSLSPESLARSDEMRGFLRRVADTVTDLHKAAFVGDLDTVHVLLDTGAQADVADYWGLTPLHYAAFAGRVDVVRLLLTHGAFVNANGQDRARMSPLHAAVVGGRLEVASILLEHGADPTQLNRLGHRPLAFVGPQGEAMRPLIENAVQDWDRQEATATTTTAPATADDAAALVATDAVVIHRDMGDGDRDQPQEVPNARRSVFGGYDPAASQ